MIFCFRTFFPINHGRQHFVFILTPTTTTARTPADKMGTFLIISLSVWSLRVQVKDWGKSYWDRRLLDWYGNATHTQEKKKNKSRHHDLFVLSGILCVMRVYQSILDAVLILLSSILCASGKKKRKKERNRRNHLLVFSLFFFFFSFLTLERACLNIKKLTMAFFFSTLNRHWSRSSPRAQHPPQGAQERQCVPQALGEALQVPGP